MKKDFRVFILILLAATFSAYSQKNSLEADNLIEFTAEDNSFKVLLPRQSEADKKKVQQIRGLLKFENINLLHPVGEMSYGIMFKDYPAAPIDEMERNARYIVHFSHLNEEMKYVDMKGHPAVEKIQKIEQGGKIYDNIMRGLFIKQRFFLISVLVPSLKNLPASKGKIYRQKADKFFDSFKALDIPPAKYEPTPLLPKDFKVSINKGFFTSEVLGLSIQIPSKWITEIHNPNRIISEDEKKASLPLRWLWRNGDRIVLAKSPLSTAKFQIGIRRREFANITLEDFVKSMATFSNLFSKTKTPLPIKPVFINGKEFLMFRKSTIEEQYQRPNIVKQEEWYFRDLGTHILEIWLEYEDESDKKIIEESLKTLKL